MKQTTSANSSGPQPGERSPDGERGSSEPRRERTTFPPVVVGYVVDPERPIILFSTTVEQAMCSATHHHPRGQLVYASDGVMRVRTASGIWLVPPTQAVWIPGNMPHQVEFPGRVVLANIFVDPSVATELPASCCVWDVSDLLRALIGRLMTVSAGTVVDAVGNLATASDEPPDAATRRVMIVLLDELRTLMPSPLHLPLAQDERVERVMDALLRAPGDNRELAEWATVACTSPRTLARLFQRETGLTFGDWRRQLRLLEAVDRLNRGQRVTGVALDLGYGSVSAFIDMFHRALGRTPGEYLPTGRPH